MRLYRSTKLKLKYSHIRPTVPGGDISDEINDIIISHTSKLTFLEPSSSWKSTALYQSRLNGMQSGSQRLVDVNKPWPILILGSRGSRRLDW